LHLCLPLAAVQAAALAVATAAATPKGRAEAAAALEAVFLGQPCTLAAEVVVPVATWVPAELAEFRRRRVVLRLVETPSSPVPVVAVAAVSPLMLRLDTLAGMVAAPDCTA